MEQHYTIPFSQSPTPLHLLQFPAPHLQLTGDDWAAAAVVPLPPSKSKGRSSGATHVESERQRREKLNLKFRELQEVVPTSTSTTDKATLLADAVSYIEQLRARMEELERKRRRAKWATKVVPCGGSAAVELEVRVLGPQQAMVRVQTERVRHPAAMLMQSLCEADAEVQQAVATMKDDVMVQNVMVKLPLELTAEGGCGLKDAILSRFGDLIR